MKNILPIKLVLPLAFLFSFLFLLMLPVKFDPVQANDLMIVATGDKNEKAKGSEAWMSQHDSQRLKSSMRSKSLGWDNKEGAFVSYKDQPATIAFESSDELNDSIVFAKGEYSGVIEIGYGASSRRIDLYSPYSDSVKIDLRELAKVNTSIFPAIYAAAKTFLLAALGFAVCILVFSPWKRPASVELENESLRVYAWIATPSLIVYGLALAAYWPAQMSPDSINQWYQVVHGDYNDAHPVLSTLIYKIAYILYPEPQSLILLQIIVFTFATSIFLKECINWGGAKKIIFIAAIALPLFPANYLIVTTIWKDSLFASGLILLSALAAREIRKGFSLSLASLALMAGVGCFVIGMRHNGIIVCVVFFTALIFFSKNKKSRIYTSVALLSQILFFVFIKFLFAFALNATAIPLQYRAIVSLHILGAMKAEGAKLKVEDEEFLNQFMSNAEWREKYQCESVVPIFWSKQLRDKFNFLGENTSKLNRIALSAIVDNPGIFLRHQTCVTGLIWRIRGNKNEWLAISPAEITDIVDREAMGLKSESLIPRYKSWLDHMNNLFVMKSSFYTRPALYLLIGIFSIGMLALRFGAHTLLIAIPSLGNLAGLSILMGAQDYRYVWPSVVFSLLAFSMLAGLAFPKNRN